MPFQLLLNILLLYIQSIIYKSSFEKTNTETEKNIIFLKKIEIKIEIKLNPMKEKSEKMKWINHKAQDS